MTENNEKNLKQRKAETCSAQKKGKRKKKVNSQANHQKESCAMQRLFFQSGIIDLIDCFSFQVLR